MSGDRERDLRRRGVKPTDGPLDRPAITARLEQCCLEQIGIVVIEGQGGDAGSGLCQMGEAARVACKDGDPAAFPG